jgi:hypothetical protein
MKSFKISRVPHFSMCHVISLIFSSACVELPLLKHFRHDFPQGDNFKSNVKKFKDFELSRNFHKFQLLFAIILGHLRENYIEDMNVISLHMFSSLNFVLLNSTLCVQARRAWNCPLLFVDFIKNSQVVFKCCRRTLRVSS